MRPLTISVPSGQQAVQANGSLEINRVSLADPGLPTTDNVILTLVVSNGTVALSTAVSGGISGSQVIGNGGGSVTVVAPLAAINATLADTNGLTYRPTSGFSSTVR